MIALVVALAAFAFVFTFWAHRNDNLTALENLDDEALAVQTADAWEARK